MNELCADGSMLQISRLLTQLTKTCPDLTPATTPCCTPEMLPGVNGVPRMDKQALSNALRLVGAPWPDPDSKEHPDHHRSRNRARAHTHTRTRTPSFPEASLYNLQPGMLHVPYLYVPEPPHPTTDRLRYAGSLLPPANDKASAPVPKKDAKESYYCFDKTSRCTDNVQHDLAVLNDNLKIWFGQVVSDRRDRKLKVLQHSDPLEAITPVDPYCCRSVMKLAEIDASLGFAITRLCQGSGHHLMDIGGEPGSFVQYLLRRSGWRNKVYSVTRKRCQEQGGRALGNFMLNRTQEPVCFFELLSGSSASDSGDITILQNQDDLVAQLRHKSGGHGLQLIVSDAGVGVRGVEFHQEMIYARLLLSASVIALQALATGGTFICKISNAWQCITRNLLFVLAQCFESLALVKPPHSRLTSNECYVVLQSFQLPRHELRHSALLGSLRQLVATEDFSPLQTIQVPPDFHAWLLKWNNVKCQAQNTALATFLACFWNQQPPRRALPLPPSVLDFDVIALVRALVQRMAIHERAMHPTSASARKQVQRLLEVGRLHAQVRADSRRLMRDALQTQLKQLQACGYDAAGEVNIPSQLLERMVLMPGSPQASLKKAQALGWRTQSLCSQDAATEAFRVTMFCEANALLLEVSLATTQAHLKLTRSQHRVFGNLPVGAVFEAMLLAQECHSPIPDRSGVRVKRCPRFELGGQPYKFVYLQLFDAWALPGTPDLHARPFKVRLDCLQLCVRNWEPNFACICGVNSEAEPSATCPPTHRHLLMPPEREVNDCVWLVDFIDDSMMYSDSE